MEELNRQLGQMSEYNCKHYEYELSKLSEAEKQRLEAQVVRMVKDGAKKPFQWAWSEFREGIPQWARFMILKGMYQLPVRSWRGILHSFWRVCTTTA